MIFLALLSCLITCSLSAGYITVKNYETTQAYYLTFILENIDASSCGDLISNVYIYKDAQWVAYNQQYDETTGYRVAFDYSNVAFSDMLAISVRIALRSGRNIDLWGIITDLNTDSSFISGELICDGTLTPTAPTPRPTTKTPTHPTTAYPTAETVCINQDELQWRSYNNQIYLNGNRFNMKGLSWFGFETGNYDLYGLDYHNVDWYLNWMVENDFNAIRLPFSQDFVNGGSSNLNKYKAIVEAAGAKGILIMLDFHSATAGSWTDGLDTINHDNAVTTWLTMADTVGDQYNVFLADVFNEPHDVDNNEWANWIAFCERVGAALWERGVNWMIAVEGTNYACNVINCAWGENLEGVRNTGITFDLQTYGANRFVWSPHVYGADVTGNPYSEEAWESHWGYLVDGTHATNEAASLIGEFGTTFTGDMVNWLTSLVTYLIQIDQRNTFYWCLNPNSGDTGGVLKSDWTTSEQGKLAQLARLQPSPSKVTYSGGRVCVSNLGEPANNPGNGNGGSTTTTTTTTTTTNNGGSSGRIKISVKDGADQWWFAVVLEDQPSDFEYIKMKSSNMGVWETGTAEWDYFKFTNNGPYEGPFSFKLKTTNGQEATTNNVITSSSVNAGDFGYANLDNAYTEENANNNTLDWTVWFAIIVSILIIIACGIGLLFYMRKRNNNKGHVEFKDSVGNDVPIDDDDDDDEEIQEIEVEMNITDGQQTNITHTDE